MSRILFVGAPYEVSARETRTMAECFEATGRNTGNLLIGNGLFQQLKCDSVQPYRYAMTPQFVEENFDQVVIAAANFLFPGFDFTPVSSFLDKIRLPVFMVGLGAQLPSSAEALANIPEGTWRLVRIASERSHSIGVRGYFTAEQLVKNGIGNVQVTGCPSFYTTLKPAARIRRPSQIARVTVNGSRNVVGHSSDKEAATRAEVGLFRLAMERGAPYVLQNEQPEMQLACGESAASHQPALASLSRFFGASADSIADYYARFGKVFFSTEEWFSWIADYDFSCGTRFHGNVAALLNGVPAVVLTHDSRTKELCEFAAIPHVPVSGIDRLSFEDLYAAANFDLFESRYNTLYREYVAFLDSNRIPHRLDWSVDLPPAGAIVA